MSRSVEKRETDGLQKSPLAELDERLEASIEKTMDGKVKSEFNSWTMFVRMLQRKLRSGEERLRSDFAVRVVEGNGRQQAARIDDPTVLLVGEEGPRKIGLDTNPANAGRLLQILGVGDALKVPADTTILDVLAKSNKLMGEKRFVTDISPRRFVNKPLATTLPGVTVDASFFPRTQAYPEPYGFQLKLVFNQQAVRTIYQAPRLPHLPVLGIQTVAA